MREETKYIVVHCSQTRPSQDIGAKDIDRWHRERGWLKIGYGKVIKRDGTIINMVPERFTAWHAGLSSWKSHKNLNNKSIGIEIQNSGHMNNYEDFSIKQIKSLLLLTKI